VKAARDAGACGIWANLLYLRPGTREHFLDSLARDWPEELDRYARLYENGLLPARRAHEADTRGGGEARERTRRAGSSARPARARAAGDSRATGARRLADQLCRASELELEFGVADRRSRRLEPITRIESAGRAGRP